MRLLSKAVPAVAVLGILALTSEAMAQTTPPTPPTECTGARETRFFNLGVIKGTSLVNQAWNGPNVLMQCENFDKFKTAVLDTFSMLTLPTGASSAVVCQFLGESAGALARVGELDNVCVNECGLDGTFVGQMAAFLYCQLSIALGGLGLDVKLTEPPQGDCGNSFETQCKAVFASTTATFTSATTPPVSCAPFTTGNFTAVFEQTENNQCLFAPNPPTP